MPEQTIHIYSVTDVPITNVDSGASLAGAGNPITNAVNGDAFSWQTPSNVAMTFGSPSASVTFEDDDSILSPGPVDDATGMVLDQSLSQPVTLNGTTYTPSPNPEQWHQTDPAVFIRSEYSVTLYDDQGNEYTMAGVSIVTGYSPDVVGVVFVDGAPPPGTTLYYIQGQSSFDPDPEIALSAICFASGSMILIEGGGEIPVEDLRLGMRVQTRDNGLQAVRWIGSRRLYRWELAAAPRLHPIRIARDALGPGLPDRDLVVSPQHRVLVRSKIAQRMFGTSEILVAAKHLLQLNGIEIAADLTEVTYVHFLLDQHQVVIANGAETESMFTGTEALKTVGKAARQEIMDIFPELQDIDAFAPPIRPLVAGRVARNLAGRHFRNHKPLVQ